MRADRWQVERLDDADALTERTAAVLTDALAAVLVDRPRASLALSGGSTPIPLLALLGSGGGGAGVGGAPLDWARVDVLQVDERLAPDGHQDRNWTAIAELLVGPTGAAPHPMPVGADDAEAAYAATLSAVAPAGIDVLHLGLGADGHTASLLPGDPVLDVVDRPVALTEVYEGWRRLTLTATAINQAGTIAWQVQGSGKRAALARLLAGDADIPGTMVRRDGSVHVLADATAWPGD
jgi:6-phosphogluconolactonase